MTEQQQLAFVMQQKDIADKENLALRKQVEDLRARVNRLEKFVLCAIDVMFDPNKSKMTEDET